jgi:hypothetical protein
MIGWEHPIQSSTAQKTENYRKKSKTRSSITLKALVSEFMFFQTFFILEKT